MADHHQKRVGREQLLRTAEELFTKHGYQGVSIRMIAEASGVTKAALYYHFENKAALFEEVMKSHSRRMNALIKEAGKTQDRTLDRLKAMAAEYFHQVSNQRSLIHLIRQWVSEQQSSERKDSIRMMTAVLQPIDDLIKSAEETGETVQLPEEFSAAAMLMGMLHSQSGYRRICHNRKLTEQDIHLLVELMWSGIAYPPGAGDLPAAARANQADGS